MARIDSGNIEEWRKIAQRCGYRVGMLCKELNVCQRQLQRLTHEAFGRSPQDWLNEQRLIFASEMLKTHRSAKVVSAELGFKQVSHFSREFKQHYGVSPRNFLAWIEAEARKRSRMSTVDK